MTQDDSGILELFCPMEERVPAFSNQMGSDAGFDLMKLLEKNKNILLLCMVSSFYYAKEPTTQRPNLEIRRPTPKHRPSTAQASTAPRAPQHCWRPPWEFEGK